MPKLPRGLSGKKIIKTLVKLNFRIVRQSGSHVVLEKVLDNEKNICIVPISKSIPVGTLASILRQANISITTFLENL